MIRAACHCTNVRLTAAQPPDWVMDCTCTLCRHYGGLWAYYEKGEVQLMQGKGKTDTYHWGSDVLL